MNRTDIKEKIIFLIITTALFLPIRFIFFTYVSDYWLGSFAAIMILMTLMLYLVKKNKLGYLGKIWKKQLLKIAKGKLGILLMIQSIIVITVFSGLLYITDINGDVNGLDEIGNQMRDDGIYSPDELLLPENIEGTMTFLGMAVGLIDNYSLGMFQHFSMVALAEEIETLVFILYFRYLYRVKLPLEEMT